MTFVKTGINGYYRMSLLKFSSFLQILKGTFKTDDFDFAVAHLDIVNELKSLKTLLKRRFPNELNGN